jgi:hypothetical protein
MHKPPRAPGCLASEGCGRGAAPSRVVSAPVSRHSLPSTVRRHLIAAAGGRDRRSAKNADRPMHQWREAHHTARPLHSPRGPCIRRRFRTRHRWVALKATRRRQGIATEQARPRAQRADLHVCAPGRIRTCNLRIRSRPMTVQDVAHGGVLAGQVGWVVQAVRPCHVVSCLAE